jgi:hypothetical protein
MAILPATPIKIAFLWKTLDSPIDGTNPKIRPPTTINVRVAFHVKSTILLRFTTVTVHHLLCMVLSLIPKLIPKWRAALVLILE